jgi:heme/copper-type cytochrome/quinol oxidase subunit 2
MAATPAVVDPAYAPQPSARRPGPLGWLLGGAAALAATAAAGVVALLFAAALAVLAVLAVVLAALAFAVWKVRGKRGPAPVISARWTGYAWDAR